MRPIERIPNFIEKVNWNNLEQRWDIDIPMSLRAILCKNGAIYKHWLKNPDWRFGQLLINLNLIPDKLRIWNDEEYDMLKDQGLDDREIMFWGRVYDENHKRLPKIQYLLIKDMTTEHIEAILRDIKENRMNIPKVYLYVFVQELTLRKIEETVRNDEDNNE